MKQNTNVNNPKCGFNKACTLFVDPKRTERTPATKKRVIGVSNSFFFHVAFFERRNEITDERRSANETKPTKYHFEVAKKSWVKGRKKTTTSNAKTERT